MIYQGVVHIETIQDGKSAGRYARFTLPNGEDYILYRPNEYPANDAFFYPYDTLQAEVEGEMEKEFGYICVRQIQRIECQNENNINQ